MSFDFKAWLKNGLINGYKSGEFTMPYITTMTANYVIKSMLTVEDASDIDTACKAWDAEQVKQEEEPEEVDPGFTHPETTPAED